MSLGASEWRGKSVFFDGEVLPQIYLVMSSANDRIFFVTPYIGLWEHLKSKIEEVMRRKIEVFFLIRSFDDEKVPRKKPVQDLAWLREQGVKVVEVPNLHAKIYMNERTILLSSMNITQPSVNNSHEFAMMLRGETDAISVREYVLNLIARHGLPEWSYSAGQQATHKLSSLVRKLGAIQVERLAPTQTVKAGACIRCGRAIDFNPRRPLCDECYPKWAKYKNENYAEKRCHSCGREEETTFRRPLCPACYSQTT